MKKLALVFVVIFGIIAGAIYLYFKMLNTQKLASGMKAYLKQTCPKGYFVACYEVVYFRYFKAVPPNPSQSPQNTASVIPTSSKSLTEPITQFKERITKKPFGIYITPPTSPVQPERFSGFHTGVDIEYQDVTADVPVYAIADGTIVLARTASGYGGVFMLEFSLEDQKQTALYGHIRPSSLSKVGTKVAKGEQLAVLGTGESPETDNERRHLHFAILADNRIDIKGYVQNQSELSGWLDPLSLY